MRKQINKHYEAEYKRKRHAIYKEEHRKTGQLEAGLGAEIDKRIQYLEKTNPKAKSIIKNHTGDGTELVNAVKSATNDKTLKQLTDKFDREMKKIYQDTNSQMENISRGLEAKKTSGELNDLERSIAKNTYSLRKSERKLTDLGTSRKQYEKASKAKMESTKNIKQAQEEINEIVTKMTLEGYNVYSRKTLRDAALGKHIAATALTTPFIGTVMVVGHTIVRKGDNIVKGNKFKVVDDFSRKRSSATDFDSDTNSRKRSKTSNSNGNNARSQSVRNYSRAKSMARSGMSYAEIAKKLGVSTSTV